MIVEKRRMFIIYGMHEYTNNCAFQKLESKQGDSLVKQGEIVGTQQESIRRRGYIYKIETQLYVHGSSLISHINLPRHT